MDLAPQPPVTLTRLRCLTGIEPVVIAGVDSTLWATAKRLKRCEVYALPDDTAIFSVWFWTPLLGRDVTFWPIDVRSSHVMTLIVQNLMAHRAMFGALRWAWGHPAADELGEPPAEIETLWRRAESEQKAA